MSTLLGYAPAIEHLQPGHPESPQRLLAIIELLESSGVLLDVTQVDITQADIDQIARVHSDSLVNRTGKHVSMGEVTWIQIHMPPSTVIGWLGLQQERRSGFWTELWFLIPLMALL